MSCISFPRPILVGFDRPFKAPKSDVWLPGYGRLRTDGLGQNVEQKSTFNSDKISCRSGSMHKLATMATMSGINNEMISQVDQSCLMAHSLISQKYISMAVHAVIELRIPDILASAEGGKPMSAEDILLQLPTKSTPGPTSVRNLQRLLSPLVRNGLFSESLDRDEPVYGLTKVSQWFVRSNPLTIAPVADLNFSPVFRGCDRFFPEVFLDETTTAFIKGNGVPAYEFHQPEFWAVFQTAMECTSKLLIKGLVDSSRISGMLDGVNTLVDVGGGRGYFVSQIVAYDPRVQGINFDLPQVIATAPAVNGVQHIAGSFFETVPSGDAAFLKWMIHNYSDEDALQILKNCYKALPAKNGKVLLAEYLKDENDDRSSALLVDGMDIAMVAYLKGARERSTEEYQALLAAAGFSRCNTIRLPVVGMSVIEAFKE